jgi:hypothetical protein
MVISEGAPGAVALAAAGGVRQLIRTRRG